VASLWPVEDGVTALYVDLFYAALADAVQPTDLATLVRDTAETLRAMGRETAVERLTDLRRRTKDPNARFRLEAAAHRAEQGAEQPFQHPCDWGAFYLTGRSEIDFSLSREATDAKS
jgi:CHAT domain-containing protein